MDYSPVIDFQLLCAAARRAKAGVAAEVADDAVEVLEVVVDVEGDDDVVVVDEVDDVVVEVVAVI